VYGETVKVKKKTLNFTSSILNSDCAAVW